MYCCCYLFEIKHLLDVATPIECFFIEVEDKYKSILCDWYVQWNNGDGKNLDDYLDAKNFVFEIAKNKAILEFNTLIDQMNFEKNINIDNIKNFFNINDLEFELKTKMTFNFNEDENNNEEFKHFIKKQQESKVQMINNKRNFENKSSSKKIFQMNIDNFYSTHEKYIKIDGKVFNIEKTITKTNLIIVSIFVFDSSEALVAKYFVRQGEKDKYE